MVDAVALAYSGRIVEAREAALAQAGSDDDFIAGQGLEALAVLGNEYGLRANAAVDALLVRCSRGSAPISRRAYEAAWATRSRALEPEAERRLSDGAATWEVLRYIGELPSYSLGRALFAGWAAIPERLRDEALLTTCTLPVATAKEAREFGRLAIEAASSGSEDIRAAGFAALRCWRPEESAEICAGALDDPSPAIRRLAAQILAEVA